MLYLFGLALVCSFIKQRDKLFKVKRNLIVFMVLSVLGITMGIVHSFYPYFPSLAMSLEKYLK